MKIVNLESTSKVTEFVTETGGQPFGVRARLWQGETESGMPVHLYVILVVPEILPDDPRQEEFRSSLQETMAPRPALDAIPLRVIL